MSKSGKHKIGGDTPLSPKLPKLSPEDSGRPEPSTSDPQTPDGVWIFVDNSNLWIEGKKAMGGEQEDPKGRIDTGKLASFLSNGRKIIQMRVYGSTPPPNDTVWAKMKECGWDVKLSQRSSVTGKEKQVDTKIVVDICKVVEHTENFGKGSTIILVSGDGDMTPVVENAMDINWNVQIWGLEKAMSYSLKELASKSDGKVSVRTLTGQEDIFFRDERFHINENNREGVLERGIVLIECKKEVNSKTRNQKWLELRNILNKINRSWEYDWLKDKKIPGDNLVIKFSPISGSTGTQMAFDTFTYIEELKKKCIPNYCQKVISYQEYWETDIPTTNIPIKNKFDVLASMNTD